MDRSHSAGSLEEALRSELLASPSPAVAAGIDRRVAAALDRRALGVAPTRGRLRRLTLAPVAAVVALVLATVAVAAALVLTAEDQQVYDMTTCMRDRGWQVVDPNVENGTGHVVPGFSTIVDKAQQPAFNADLEQCANDVGIPFQP